MKVVAHSECSVPYDIPHFILVLVLRQFHYVIHAGPNAKMMGATTPGSVHFFYAQRIESTVAQLPQQRSRVDRDDITEMTSGGSAQLWRKERSSLGVCGSHLAEQGQPFSDKDKVALH